MNIVLKKSLTTGLFFTAFLIVFQGGYASGLDEAPVSLQNVDQQSTSKGYYILPPPSPFFSSDMMSNKKKLGNNAGILELVPLDTQAQPLSTADVINEMAQNNNDLKDKVYGLEVALTDNKEQSDSLLEELHATARNADFENEMYEKTMSLLQGKITILNDNNEALTVKLSSAELTTRSQQRLLTRLRKESAELSVLKNTYKERDDEILVLKKELLNLKKEPSQKFVALPKAEVQTLRDAYTVKSKEVETYKAEVIVLYDKLSTFEQTQTELIDLQNFVAELNENNSLLKAKIVEVEALNKSLTSQLNKIQQDKGQQLRKLALLKRSSAELVALKSAYKERNDEVIALKGKVIELDSLNKTLLSKVKVLENNTIQNTRKMSLLEQSSSELIALKSTYKERNEETGSLKETLRNISNSNRMLLSQIKEITSNDSQKTHKLALLDQSVAELMALKSTYKDRNAENIELQKKILTLSKNKQDINKQLSKLNAKAEALQASNKTLSDNNTKLTDKLKQQKALKSTVDASTHAIRSLEGKLDESKSLRKSLSGEILTLKADFLSQQRKLTSLSSVGKKLESLSSAYKVLKKEKRVASDKLTAAMLDDDKDGVVNTLDQCLSSPFKSLVNNIGCAEISDTDVDQIPDTNDLCLNTAIGIVVNKFGCAVNESIILNGVNFNTGSDSLTFSSLATINSVASTLKTNLNIKVEIAGHTDGLGIKSGNQELSERRANAVTIQLIGQGVDAARISTKGYGESNPIVPNDTAEGRLKNRRVELKIH